jgi:hypothetical protein
LVGEDFLDGDWSTVIVGDILKVQIDEEFPADLVFLSSSDPQGKHELHELRNKQGGFCYNGLCQILHS